MKRKSGTPLRGRILRVKKGFNPNSSSISSEIIVFFTAAAGVTALFAVAASIAMECFSEKSELTADADQKQPDK